MAEPERDRLDVALWLALALLGVALPLLLFGPGRSAVAAAEAQAARLGERAEAWRRQLSGYRAAGERERAGWTHAWSELARLVPVSDDFELTLAVGRLFEQLPVRHVQVTRVEGAEVEELLLQSPLGDDELRVRGLPVDVEFRAGFADAVAVVRGLERESLLVRLEELEFAHEPAGVSARLRLVYFTRAGERT
jgi:hypothetical protein